jgi:hypothetical protein
MRVKCFSWFELFKVHLFLQSNIFVYETCKIESDRKLFITLHEHFCCVQIKKYFSICWA